MKKFIILCIGFLFASSLVSAQTFRTGSQKVNISKRPVAHESGTVKTTITDTLYFLINRLSDPDSAKAIELSNLSASGMGQYFPAPQGITINGAWIIGISYPQPQVSCTVSVYTAGADSLPTGPPLGSAVVFVDSSVNNGIDIFAGFSPAITVTQPYVITITNATTNPVYIYSTNYKTHDGQGDGYSCASFAGLWGHAALVNIDGDPFDADFLFSPIVAYTLPAPSFSFTPACLSSNNQNVGFTLNVPAVWSSEIYNYWANIDNDSIQNQFFWFYGDGSYESGLSVNHSYALPGLYPITLYYYFAGWTYYTPIDSITDSIGLCTGINTVPLETASVYPNPANDFLIIENSAGCTYEIFNSLNELLLWGRISHENEIISISNYPCGTYYLRLVHKNGTTTRRLCIMR